MSCKLKQGMTCNYLLPRCLLLVSIGLLVVFLFTFHTAENTVKLRRLRSRPASENRKDNPAPIPGDDVLKNMPFLELVDFFYGYILSTQELCSRRVRMGNIGDGGWDLCEDPRFKPNQKDCLVYSFGIAHDPSFDIAIEKYGCEVHSFDPSLGKYDPSLGQNFHFHALGIGPENRNRSNGWRLHTLGKSRELNGHLPLKRQLDVVKMDVEGAELGSLEKALEEGSLEDVKQLAFEIHVVTTAEKNPNKEYILRMLRLLRNLWHTGFRLFHTNRNLAAPLIYVSAVEKKPRTKCYELYMVKIH